MSHSDSKVSTYMN